MHCKGKNCRGALTRCSLLCYHSITLLRIQGNPVKFRDGDAAVNGHGRPISATAQAGRQGRPKTVSQKTYPWYGLHPRTRVETPREYSVEVSSCHTDFQ